MTTYRPPCYRSDEWTQEANKLGGATTMSKTLDEKQEAYEATLRAQLTCLTACKIRQQCLTQALSRPEDHGGDYHVYGGYTGAERNRIRHGLLEWPSAKAVKVIKWDRVYALLSGDSMALIAQLNGLAERTVGAALKAYIWALRLEQGDDFASFLTDTSVSPETVRAA